MNSFNSINLLEERRTSLIGVKSPKPSSIFTQKGIFSLFGMSTFSLIIILVHMSFADAMYSTTAAFLASLLAIVAYISGLRIYLRVAKNELPFRELYIIAFYVFFGFPIFFKGELGLIGGSYLPTAWALNAALYAALLSITCFYFSCSIGRKIGNVFEPEISKLLSFNVSLSILEKCLIFIILPIVIVISYYVDASVTVESGFKHVLYSVFSPFFALAVLCFLGETYHRKMCLTAVYLTCLVLFILGLSSGMLEKTLSPIVIVIIVKWILGRRIPVLPFVILLLFFGVLNPAKLIYRAESQLRSQSSIDNLGIEDKYSIWVYALTRTWGLDNEKDSISDNLDTTRNRLSDLLPVAQTIEEVPDIVPYANGEPWLAIPYSFVPRLIWPEKPSLNTLTNARYAISFRRLYYEQLDFTSINIPQLVDGYWNFGWLGVAIVATLAGLTIGIQSVVFNTSNWATGSLGVLFLISMRPQADLYSLIGGGVQRLIGAITLLGILYVLVLVSGGNINRRVNY